MYPRRAALVGALTSCVLGLGLLVVPTPAGASDPVADAPAADTPDATVARTDQLIVTATSAAVSDATLEATTEQAAADLGLDVTADVKRDMTHTTSVIRLDSAIPVDDAASLAAEVAQSDAILRAEPDLILQPDVTLPNDYYTSSQWGLWDSSKADGGYSTRAPDAWPTSKGNGVVVAVIDTGITSHPDLNAHVLPGYDFIGDTWTANDGNGRDSDASDPGDWITAIEEADNGYDFWGNPYCPEGDSSWHGTHVAGTIAALTDDTIGVAAIAPNASILPARVLGKCGGYTSDIADAVTWSSGGTVGGVPANPTPARVLNLSLGGRGACGATMQNAINGAIGRGSSVVVAAGNSNADAVNFMPANCNGVVTVAAHSSNGHRAWFSNYGATVEVSAPGVGIWSTLNTGTQGPITDTYDSYSGTSMAAPHVAGVVALMLAADPGLSPAQVSTNLLVTSQPFATGSTCISMCGAGYVDGRAAVGALAPGTPLNLTVTPDYEELDISWSAPASGMAPVYYAVQHSIDGLTWTTDDTRVSTSTTIAGLNPADAYVVRVRAVNGAKTGAWATSLGYHPLARTTPGPVGTVTALPDDTSATATWSAPTDTGGHPILYYEVAHSTDDTTWTVDDTTTSTTTTITGLTNAVAYHVRIRAVNTLGPGVGVLSNWVTPRILTTPAAPQGLNASAGDGSLAVSWAAPADDGGRPITSYAVETSPDDSTWTARGSTAALSMTISGLANGQHYSVRVAATTTQGQGAWATSGGTPVAPAAPAPPPPPPAGGGGGGAPPPPTPTATPPGAPTISGATSGDRSISLAWMPPDDTGGAAVTGYAIELDAPDGTRTLDAQATTLTIDQLTNGTAYRARVAAVNSAGAGSWSSWTDAVTPWAPASAPRELTAAPGDASARISWSIPIDDGGSPISGYILDVMTAAGSRQLTVADSSTVLTGLANGVVHSIRVAATTAHGQGTWTDPVTVTPKAVALSAPTNVQATRKRNRIAVSWSAPKSGTPLSYLVSASINGKSARVVATATGLRTTFDVTAKARSIVLTVAAVDAQGRGPQSSAIVVRSTRSATWAAYLRGVVTA